MTSKSVNVPFFTFVYSVILPVNVTAGVVEAAISRLAVSSAMCELGIALLALTSPCYKYLTT